MKKSTVVLTAALAASVFGLGRAGIAAPTTTAQALASLTPKGYDATLAANSLAANSDAAAMLAAINAVRRGNGLPQLTLDASLGAATMYQETDELQYHYVGSYGLLNNGAKQVSPAQMAADFGSAATGVQEYAFGNGFFMGDTDNWPALMSDWQQNDTNFAAMLNNPNVNVAGIDLVDTGGVDDSGRHIYKWSLMVGNISGGAKASGQSTAQALASLTPKGYDATLAANSLAANSDAAAMLAAINAVRRGNGLPQLTLDASLGAATMYQETDELQYHYVGSYGLLNNGAKQVSPAQMAADFGSAATGVQEYAFGNGFFMGDTDNWPALMSDWQQNDTNFAAMLNNPNVNVAGIDLVDTGGVDDSGRHIYKWSLMVGNDPNAVTKTTSTGPTVNTSGLVPALAQQALAAKPTADETNFLAAINAYRSGLGTLPLTMTPTLYSAAYYKVHETGNDSISSLGADFGDAHATFASSANSNTLYYDYLLGYYSQWDILVTYWRITDNTFNSIVGDGSYTHCGFSIVDTGTQQVSLLDGQPYEVYNWILVGAK